MAFYVFKIFWHEFSSHNFVVVAHHFVAWYFFSSRIDGRHVLFENMMFFFRGYVRMHEDFLRETKTVFLRSAHFHCSQSLDSR